MTKDRTNTPSPKEAKAKSPRRPARLGPPQPPQVFRVEGIGRRGVIRYVKVIGRPGSWRIRGMDGLNVVVRAATVEEAVRRARRQIPFRPIVIRRMTPEELHSGIVATPPPTDPTKNT
ncbi:MAG: hypothetical protein N2Z21_02945 [Candidatus Sumerlaeaceae bacterium]|nr:hypothetical protein [Candidatus Sumerlaeaceae bacterium]